MQTFNSKRAAITAIKALGFTEELETSESGDHGWGSRIYFGKPGEKRTAANVSKCGREWVVLGAGE